MVRIMNKESVIEIEICMGSSCFARGNNKAVALIQDYIAETADSSTIKLKGALCKRRCKEGPVISVNGQDYTGIDGPALLDVVKSLHAEMS